MNACAIVTGIGLETGLGRGRRTWEGLLSGRSAIVRLGEERGFSADAPPRYGAPLARLRTIDDLLDQLIADALEDANLRLPLAEQGIDPSRVGVAIGLSKGDLTRLRELVGWPDHEPDWTRFWPHGAASHVSRSLGATGPSLAPVAACATGLVAALRGLEWIRRGECDLVVVGAVDVSLDPLVIAAFARMNALAKVDPSDPTAAMRPWSRDRSGFLVGEGGALLVLESPALAHRRGARSLARLVGGAIGSDAFHPTNLDPNPRRLAELILQALDDGAMRVQELDHLNVHGTATSSNDPLECQAARRALGIQADRVICVANKPQFGHLLGGAGAVELAVAVWTLSEGVVPPTLNTLPRDPVCDLQVVVSRGQPRPVRTALKISLGFGGHLAAAVLRREEG